MEQDDEGDKPHEPTAKKLEDARKRGEIVRSTDLTILAVYGGFLIACLWLAPWGLTQMGQALTGLIRHADSLATETLVQGHGAQVRASLMQVGLGALPLFLVPAALALVSVVAQRALLFTPSKLLPKLNRISILGNAKQKFGATGLFEFAKSTAKLSVYSLILTIVLANGAAQMIALVGLDPSAVILAMFDLTQDFLWKVVAVALLLGVLDYMFQRATHLRKNRMSHKELLDEVKAAEGDPHFKGHRRQKGYQIAMSQMLADVPKADVVVVNPTHFAVALKWDRLSGRAPVCVAKGVDHMAAAIRERAIEAGVPIHSDPPTARALHASLEIGDEVRPDHYKPVAAAIRFAETVRKLKAQRG